MDLPDVNVLVHAHREDSILHDPCLRWLTETLESDRAYGVSELVLSGFLRVVTHPRVFAVPTDITMALLFVEQVRSRPNCVVLHPGTRHWPIFAQLCRSASVRGNLVPDAFLAALAIESGSRWVTTDRDFARFPGLSWIHPDAA